MCRLPSSERIRNRQVLVAAGKRLLSISMSKRTKTLWFVKMSRMRLRMRKPKKAKARLARVQSIGTKIVRAAMMKGMMMMMEEKTTSMCIMCSQVDQLQRLVPCG